ncbi:MAG: two-component system, NtrC family, response regulator PilR [Blastocatellia bacterium]|jgi:two-component system response regulator PilR (NtrC family)|nr:two-component system, NtrC family, response regulator PilR [Blastocatellia bacterium]
MASILVVDDDEAIRDTLYELFAGQYLCHTAETAERALTLLRSEIYDVVLTDISMPGLSGLELLGHVVQSYPGTPVIVISGISDQEHAQGLIKLGAFDYLLKPFGLEVVEDSVRRAVAYRRKLANGNDGDKSGSSGSESPPAKADWAIVPDDSKDRDPNGSQ